MYIKTMIAVLFTFFLLLSGCGGGSEDNLKLKSDDPSQDALNKITLYAETDGKSSVPSIEDYTLAGVVGVTSENLTLLNQKVSKSDARNVDDPKKIEQILKNQDFDGDGVKDRLDNCPLVANTGQADSDNNGIGDVCDTTLGDGITIQNSVDMIWEDMNGINTGYTSNMPRGFGQFKGPSRRDINSYANSFANQTNVWFEVESAGDGGSCSLDISRATNTKVQIGWTRAYYLMNDDSWVLVSETKDQLSHGGGGRYPHAGYDPFPIDSERCNPYTSIFYDEQMANLDTTVVTKVAGKFTTAKPENSYRYHAWAAKSDINLSQVKGIFGQTYIRLIVDNPDLPDDRHLANYVGHVGGDSYSTTSNPAYKGDNGISRYKEITNDWQPFNFYSGSWENKAALAANPPPFTSTP